MDKTIDIEWNTLPYDLKRIAIERVRKIQTKGNLKLNDHMITLPKDCLLLILSKLCINDIAAFSTSCKYYYNSNGFYQEILNSIVQNKKVGIYKYKTKHYKKVRLHIAITQLLLTLYDIIDCITDTTLRQLAAKKDQIELRYPHQSTILKHNYKYIQFTYYRKNTREELILILTLSTGKITQKNDIKNNEILELGNIYQDNYKTLLINYVINYFP